MTAAAPAASKSPAKAKKAKHDDPEQNAKATRETIESVVIAIILAFLFRSFEAEAFVIPTGSMAPTLQGRHKDVVCPQCGHQYRTGASEEERTYKDAAGTVQGVKIAGTVCPICRFTFALDPFTNWNEASFNGDRILVSKFAYQIAEPERWDPIVFKFPGNAKQNYIKRLVGLPNEKLRISHGDVFAQGKDDTAEHILRKPPHKQAAMLQLVDDTNYLAPALVAAKWPSRWQSWQSPSANRPATWSMTADGKSFTTTGEGDEAWLRYRHLVPRVNDWYSLETGALPTALQGLTNAQFTAARQQLITDFYTYNTNYQIYLNEYNSFSKLPQNEFLESIQKNWRAEAIGDMDGVLGKHWVGDLAVEVDAEVQNGQGEILLDLVEGGSHYTCRIDVATGIAKLSIDQGQTSFVGKTGDVVQFPEAKTAVRGPGNYQLRFANCDDRLTLWVNGSPVAFNAPTTYANRPDCAPKHIPADPGDMAPAGVGSDKAAVTFSKLRILRDVYYIALEAGRNDYTDYTDHRDYPEAFTDPSKWETTTLFSSRRSLPFTTGPDQFFPLGDNSPASQDARSWGIDNRNAIDGEEPFYAPPFVRRELLIGKALLIYWPHAWNRPVMFTPNVQRMGVIR